jgi:hypothetical protein
MSGYIISHTKLAVLETLYQQGINLPARKVADLNQLVLKNLDAITINDGVVRIVGLSPADYLDQLRSTSEGKAIFDDGLEGAGVVQGQPKTGNDGDAATLTEVERCAREAGLTLAEWNLKGPAFHMDTLAKVKGPARANWQSAPKTALSSEAAAQLSPEEKIALANENYHNRLGGQS